VSTSNLCRYLEDSAARFPARPAAVDPDGTILTYSELDARATSIAGFLAERGVRPGDRVGVVLPKNLASLTAVFGILKARAAYVPVDWKGPAERARTILSGCRARAAFVDATCPDLTGAAEHIIAVEPATWKSLLEHDPITPAPREPDPDDLAYILYTSGSTGVPKGVMLTHRNATSYVDWCSEVFTPTEDDRFSSHAPFYFDLSILDIYVPIKHGASVHLIPDDLGKNPKDLARFIAGHRLTVWYSTPATLGLLAEFGGLEHLDCSSLRLVLFAGEVFPVKQLRRVVSQWPAPVYYNLYGPTETNVCTFAEIPKPIPEDRAEPYPIGWPCSHCEALVLDSGEPVPPGEEGVLYIAGPSVFSGYWGRAGESAKVFLERGGKRWYNTGDVVKLRAGEGFIYVGRRDRMVKRRGYRIELGEIESCLYRHPAIAEAAVIAVPHADSGTRIIGYLTAPPDSRPSIVELKTFCNRHLPAYMNPDVFLFAGALPRTSTNKVDYQALIRRFQSGA
jgi:amino acid adenylation domain-containing protein